MASNSKFVADNVAGVGDGFQVRDIDGTEFRVIDQDGETFNVRASTTDPTAEGQITYKTGVGYRGKSPTGVFTFPTSGGGGGSDTLDSAYENGRAVGIDLGAIVWTDATAAGANTMEFVQSGAKTGNILDFAVNATLTGNVIDIDLNSGVGAKAIYIDGGGGTRTAVPFDIKHDGDGNVAAMNITASNTGTGAVFTVSMDGNGSGGGVFNVDMNAAVGAEYLYLDAGGGTRTANLFEVKNDGDGNVDAFSIVDSNTGSGSVFDLNMDGNGSGSVIDCDMNAAVGEEFLYLDAGAGTRTVNLIEVKNDGDGNVDVISIVDSNTGSGALFDLNMDGNGGGSVIDVDMNAAVDEEFLLLDTGAGTRTANMFDITYDGDGAVHLFQISASDTSSGHIMNIAMAGLHTGNVFNVDMDAAVDAYVLYVDGGADTRTVPAIYLKHDGDGDVGMIATDVTNTGAGHVIDIAYGNVINTGDAIHIDFVGAAASTGNGLYIDTGTNVAGSAISILTAGARSAPVIFINGAGTDGGTDDHIIDINQSGQLDSNVLDITYSAAASTGYGISLTTGTNVAAGGMLVTTAGIRTGPVFNIDAVATDSNTAAHIFDIDVTGQTDSNVFDIEYADAAGASTGDVFKITMGTAVAGTAINLIATGARTDDLIQIDSDHTDVGVIFDINLSGAGSGNCLDITYATGANTGNAIDLNMGTNVAGMAISYAGAATGTSGEGSALDVKHTGALGAGADLVRINSTGSHSSTSNLLSIEHQTGACTTGTNGLYIKVEGANIEAIKVDAGNVTFGEALNVTGATTLSSTLSYRDLTEVVAATNVITAAESGSVFFLNHATEFASTLPAPAAGLHYTFIVTASPSGASYTITTNAAAAVIFGSVSSAAGDAGAATADTAITTISLVDGQANIGDSVQVWCDGTYWYAQCVAEVAAGITFA